MITEVIIDNFQRSRDSSTEAEGVSTFHITKRKKEQSNVKKIEQWRKGKFITLGKKEEESQQAEETKKKKLDKVSNGGAIKANYTKTF